MICGFCGLLGQTATATMNTQTTDKQAGFDSVAGICSELPFGVVVVMDRPDVAPAQPPTTPADTQSVITASAWRRLIARRSLFGFGGVDLARTLRRCRRRCLRPGREGVEGLLVRTARVGNVTAAGGRALIQDRETATIFGMPQAALQTAGADRVVSLREMPMAIVQMLEAARDAS